MEKIAEITSLLRGLADALEKIEYLDNAVAVLMATAVSPAPQSAPVQEAPVNKGKRWTKQEIHIMNNLDRSTPIEKICEMFGRDKKAIENVLYANWGGVRLWQQGAELKTR